MTSARETSVPALGAPFFGPGAATARPAPLFPDTEVAAALSIRARSDARIPRAYVAAIDAPDGSRLVVGVSGLQRAGGRVVGDLRLTSRSKEGHVLTNIHQDALLAVALRPRWPDEAPEGAVDTGSFRKHVLRLSPLTLLDPFLDRWLVGVTAQLARVAQDDEDDLGPFEAPVAVDEIQVGVDPDWHLIVADVRFDGALSGDVRLAGPNETSIDLLLGRVLLTSGGEPSRALRGTVRRRAERALTLRLRFQAARAARDAVERLGGRLAAVWWALASSEIAQTEVP